MELEQTGLHCVDWCMMLNVAHVDQQRCVMTHDLNEAHLGELLVH